MPGKGLQDYRPLNKCLFCFDLLWIRCLTRLKTLISPSPETKVGIRVNRDINGSIVLLKEV